MSVASMPEQVLFDLVTLGIAAIKADPTQLDLILAQLDTDQQTKARTWFAAHEPTVIHGFARSETPLPAYAITLQSDGPGTDYLGMGEQLNADDVLGGGTDLYQDRETSTFAIYCYATSPDAALWMYRILKRVMRVGFDYLINNGLEEPKISGADLMPDPRFTPAHLFTRVLRLQVEYEEAWTSGGSLW